MTKDMDIAVTKQDLHNIRIWLNKKKIKYFELEIGGINVDQAEGINVDFITRCCDFGDFSLLFDDAIQYAVECGEKILVGMTNCMLYPRNIWLQ
ncbi:MAG: hypothetical protein GY749_12045 [Desulfobacteraceae bacterium]|nr:hypothetical protein [Desulfobacteraceae bacterium]